MTTASDDTYLLIHGTSEAAPVVSASIAYILAKGWSMEDLLSTAKPVGENLWAGLINLANACKNIKAHQAPVNKKDWQDNVLTTDIDKIITYLKLPSSRHEWFKKIILEEENAELLVQWLLVKFDIQSIGKENLQEVTQENNSTETSNREELIGNIFGWALSFFLFILAINSLFNVLWNIKSDQ
jgi:hypothetical protein